MTSALIVIDVQNSFRQHPEWESVSNPDIVRRTNDLVERARAGAHPVFWVLHAAPGTSTIFDPERGLVSLMPDLAPLPGEASVIKTSRNAFTSTNLQQQLTRLGVTEVVISGIQTEQCCETTARVAADLGYSVTFVTEATATFPITRADTGAVLGTDEVIERTEFALAGRFARISSIADAFAPSEDAASA